MDDIWRDTLRRSLRDFEALRTAGLAAVIAWGPSAEALKEAKGSAALASIAKGYKRRLAGHELFRDDDERRTPNGWPMGLDSAGFVSVYVHAEEGSDASRDACRRFIQAGERAMRAVAGAPDGVFRAFGFSERYSGSPRGECWLALLFALAWRPVRGSDLRAEKWTVHGGAAWGPGFPEMLKQCFPPGPLPWFSILPDLGPMSEAAVALIADAKETTNGEDDDPDDLDRLCSQCWKAYTGTRKKPAKREVINFAGKHPEFRVLVETHCLSADKIYAAHRRYEGKIRRRKNRSAAN